MSDHVSENILNYVSLLEIKLSESKSIIEILKAGVVHDRGLKITEAMLEDFVTNFNAGCYGTDVQINFGHNREGEAAGWVTKLIKEGDLLLAEVEWTPIGQQRVSNKEYRFTSAELALSYPHFKTGEKIKNVLIGVALTNIPAVKGMKAVQLSEATQLFLNNHFMKDAKAMYDKLMAKDSISKKEMEEFEEATKGMKDEELGSMKKKLAAKVKEEKLSEKEGEEEEEKKEVEKEEEKEGEELSQKGKYVSLAEYNRMKRENEKERKENEKMRMKVEKMELSEEIQNELVLSEDIKTGFNDDEETLNEVLDFMMGLSQEQRNSFKAIIAKVQTVDLSTIGSTNSVKVQQLSEDDKQMQEAEERAKKLSQETGKPYEECLSDEYSKLDLAKKK